jgi:hypothetical protein
MCLSRSPRTTSGNDQSVARKPDNGSAERNETPMPAILALLAKIASSSTFWVSILLPALKVLLAKIGIDIPWEAIMAGQGSYAVKEAAAKVSVALATQKVPAATKIEPVPAPIVHP